MLKTPVHKKLPFWQRPITVKPLSLEEIEQKYRRRCHRGVRSADRDATGKVIPGTERLIGKTEKDHKSGAWHQRFGHRIARAKWTNNRGSRNETWKLGMASPE